MIKDAINRILELDRPQIVGIGGRDYSSKKIEPVLDPQPKPLGLSTLSGLVAFCLHNIDELQHPLIAHVRSDCEVALIGPTYGTWQQRDVYAMASHREPSAFKANTYYPLEDFLITLNTSFVVDDVVRGLTRLFGNVRGESVTNWSDDGISQAVLSRSGIALVENVPVPNLVTLQPYRTFRDIEQPEGLFLVRARQKDDGPPAVALFEAEGEQWRFLCQNRIVSYLEEFLPEGVFILK